MSDESPQQRALTMAQEVEIRHMVEELLTRRTMPEHPMYFVNGYWLVTHDWLRATVEPLRSELAYLQRQINELQRPWWKRWFA